MTAERAAPCDVGHREARPEAGVPKARPLRERPLRERRLGARRQAQRARAALALSNPRRRRTRPASRIASPAARVSSPSRASRSRPRAQALQDWPRPPGAARCLSCRAPSPWSEWTLDAPSRRRSRSIVSIFPAAGASRPRATTKRGSPAPRSSRSRRTPRQETACVGSRGVAVVPTASGAGPPALVLHCCTRAAAHAAREVNG